MSLGVLIVGVALGVSLGRIIDAFIAVMMKRLLKKLNG